MAVTARAKTDSMILRDMAKAPVDSGILIAGPLVKVNAAGACAWGVFPRTLFDTRLPRLGHDLRTFQRQDHRADQFG